MIEFLPTIDAPEDIILPQRSTRCAAGYDFYAPCDIFLKPNSCSELVKLYVKIVMPQNMYLELHNRSSLAVKNGVVLECGGVIDADYANNTENDGCICVKFRNNEDKPALLGKGSRICQGIIKHYFVTDSDSSKVQAYRNGGFGSTGK